MKFYIPVVRQVKAGATRKKILLVMKLTVVLMIAALMEVSATGFAQKVTLSAKQITLKDVFRQIRKQTGYNVLWNVDILKDARPVALEVTDASVEEVLRKSFANQPFTYTIRQNTIVVTRTSEQARAAVTIKGRVTDTEKNPLPGVAVRLKNTQTGTATLPDGTYSLNVPDGTGVLEFRLLGYTPKEVSINGQTVINVQLEKASSQLGEIVVAYGRQNAREIVGSVSKLNASEMKDQPTGTFAERLQGKLPGAQVAQTTGRPGQGMDLRIRGAASLTSKVRPLVVVDGQPMIGDPDNINNINPDEIETFTILKDAAATSLYGSRAANGVIIITTKRGKAGATQINFNSYYGTASLMRELIPPVMNARQLATYMKGFYEDKIKYEGYTGGIPAVYQNPEQYGEGTDWFSELTRTAPVQNYSIAINAGTEKAAYSVIGGFFDQQGILKNTGYKRFSLRVNGDFNPGKRVKIGVGVAPSLQLEHNNRQGTGFNVDGQRAIFASASMIPTMGSPYNPDGSLALGITGFTNQFVWANPLRQLLEVSDDANRLRVLANVFAEVKLTDNLTFRTSGSTDLANMNRKRFIPSTSMGGFNALPMENPPPGNNSAYGQSTVNNDNTWLNENTLNYQQQFGKDHSLSALAGFTIQRSTGYFSDMVGRDYPDNSVPYLSAATRFTTNTSNFNAWSMVSLLGRVNYSFKDRYLVQAAVRRDGSSRFGDNNKWGTFPSIGASWIASDEPFLKDIKQLSFLKLRASYGLTGMNEIGNYTPAARIDNANYTFSGSLAPGKVQSTFGNADLAWERNRQFDAGIDIGLLDGRLTLTYDYYNKLTEGLLYELPLPQSSGFNKVQDNLGDIRQWGHEITVSSKNMVGKFKWNTDFNISFNRNIVKRIGLNNIPFAADPTITLSEFTDFRTLVGKPIGQFYGYIFDGIFKNQAEADAGPKYYGTGSTTTSQAGTVRFKDLNGDGKITFPEDQTVIGDPNPKFIFGLTNSFQYQHFDLSITMSGTYGNKLKNGMQESTYNLDGVFNGPPELLERWRSESDPGNGRVARTLAGTTAAYRTDNTLFVHDASHLTINNITLGYMLRKFRTPYIKSLRIYASAQNVYIFTSYPGNPEVSAGGGLAYVAQQGQDLGAYPLQRTFTFGLNLGL
ncbi:TonB-linked SusC/RagA family outer membrane protein [Chitinophaga terrae (ex Kim and Jung 2007)]|uniref:TonB-dependent receptor n=1 Tax=Chitinophaga terrae (ex Kim and Jung 2007) TaxID=408074 RepID=UPI002788694A|nr:TonB-dependent receptor [Chitinophaga terrae (ex Kim and Jung 2007)]MDQ0108998.1 TonB-linked SusC/RagA family outer membrane protein [Chitinophaga terrae (ex Kim and Jung 2007)]